MNQDTKFEVILGDGRRYHTGEGGSVTDWWVDSDYLTSTDGWRCSFQSKDKKDRERLEWAPVEIRVDGRPQLLGRIDATIKGGKGNLVEIHGRDYLSDMVECGIDPLVTIKAGDKLDQALLQAMGPVGIVGFEDPEVKMESRTGAAPKKVGALVAADMQQGKPEPGMGIFQWGNQIAVRHGYTIQCASRRDKVCLEAPNYIQDINYHIARRDSGVAESNVISGTARRDYSSLPTYVAMTGSSGKPTEKLARAMAGIDVAAIAVGLGGPILDAFVYGSAYGRQRPSKQYDASKLYRLMYFRDKKCKSLAQLTEATLRALSEHMRKTLDYEVTLKGTRDPKTGLTYAVNTLARVDDELADVSDILWVARRGMGTSEGQGVITRMNMWLPGAFVLGTEEHGSGKAVASKKRVTKTIDRTQYKIWTYLGGIPDGQDG